MLPVCSSCRSSPSPISFNVGAKSVSSVRKLVFNDKAFFASFGVECHETSSRLQVSKSSLLPIVGSIDQAGSPEDLIFSPYIDDLDDILHGFSDVDDEIRQKSICLAGQLDKSCSINNEVTYVASSAVPEDKLLVNDMYVNGISKVINDNTVAIPETTNIDLHSTSGNEFLNLQDPLNQPLNDPASSIPEPNSVSSSFESIVIENTSNSSSSPGVTTSFIFDQRENMNNVISDAQKSLDSSISKAKGLIEETFNSFDTFIKTTLKSTSDSFDNGIDGLLSSAGNTKEQANIRLSGFSDEFRQSISNAGSIAIDALRHGLFYLEGSISKAVTFVAYSYESSKTMLPPEIRHSLNISEEKATIILRPVQTAMQEVYFLIESVERNLGFDPNDPITSFVIFLGGSATLGISYWFVRYGGYSGDLSPQSTLELLKNEKSAVLIDVRAEDERGREGIPDLRRGSRFKYASVTFPELSGFAKKQLKNVKHIDDALLAVVIRNLQIVNSGSMVIVMDTKGERSKEIARSLRRLGIKRPYLVKGGFRSWIENGLRVKELRPETALKILNEEAEAIIEEIKPTPSLVFGTGLGLIAAIYALIEWEKTLQLVGFIGLGQSLYRRFTSYESSEDLKEDLRRLLTPIKLGAQALSLSTGSSETNKIGLPTSPSSTSVQDRVLQAAAKHESQPSDSSENPSRQSESSSQTEGEGLDLSKA